MRKEGKEGKGKERSNLEGVVSGDLASQLIKDVGRKLDVVADGMCFEVL